MEVWVSNAIELRLLMWLVVVNDVRGLGWWVAARSFGIQDACEVEKEL